MLSLGSPTLEESDLRQKGDDPMTDQMTKGADSPQKSLETAYNTLVNRRGAQEPRCARSEGRRGTVGFYMVVAGNCWDAGRSCWSCLCAQPRSYRHSVKWHASWVVFPSSRHMLVSFLSSQTSIAAEFITYHCGEKIAKLKLIQK